MELRIPIYVETTAAAPGKPSSYSVRPLFFDAPVVRSQHLQGALQKLSQEIREVLLEHGREPRQDEILAWTYNPEVETRQCRIRLELGGTSVQLRVLLAMIERFERTLAFAPAFPHLWFEVLEGEDTEQRLVEVLTQHFHRQPREGRRTAPEAIRSRSLEGSAWVTELEMSVSFQRLRHTKELDVFAMLARAQQLDGEIELFRVGRCLNHLYPHGLERAVLRDSQVEELARLFESPARRPVLLVGQRQSGKTAILHEFVFRRTNRTKSPFNTPGSVWLIAPQRLISGMSIVGQWESRFHAIMTYAAKRDLTLYFDDLPGLFQAGVVSDFTVSAADLLKAVIERGEVRIVGEVTPEAHRVLEERDRAFADQFHVIRVDELSAADNLRVLVGHQRQLEIRHRVRFELDALPAIIDLQRRYVRDAAFPGKAAELMKRLAIRAGAGTGAISRENVLDLLHEQSGLPRSFLDERLTVGATEIEEGLRRRFVGQPAAVRAAVEVIGVARARLNDTTRPLASLFLPGPTGVGKTEFAKAVAGYLFGSSERLLRFDMNEFVTPDAVPLLAGTFSHPEGLLTSAVRRQPFAVLLFDEIEKAHPCVFDLLLQVLGEGRLTDARGRTTDFTNTLIILTSNLGTRRRESNLGFGGGEQGMGGGLVRAAETFFRPEFFNRLDRVIAFDELCRSDLQRIARHFLTDLMHREGLVRRQCVVRTTLEAGDWIVSRGYNQVQGARALKRTIEHELTQPIADFLAEHGSFSGSTAGEHAAESAGPITLIEIDRGGAGLSISMRTLVPRQAEPALSANTEGSPEEMVAACRRILTEAENVMPTIRPLGELGIQPITAVQSRYLLVYSEYLQLRDWLDEISGHLSPQSTESATAITSLRRITRLGGTSRKVLSRLRFDIYGDRKTAAVAAAINDYVQDGLSSEGSKGEVNHELQHLLPRCRWLLRVAGTSEERLEESAVLHISCLDSAHADYLKCYVGLLIDSFTDEVGLETELVENDQDACRAKLIIRGILALDVAGLEAGYQAIVTSESAVPGLLYVKCGEREPGDTLVRSLKFESSGQRPTLIWPTPPELQRGIWEMQVITN